MTNRNGLLVLFLLALFLVMSGTADAGNSSDSSVDESVVHADAPDQFCKVDLKSSGRRRPVQGKDDDRRSSGDRVSGTTTSSSAGQSAMVSNMRSWSNPDYTRVVITLDREVGFSHHKLRRDPSSALPERIYIDFTGARIAPGVKDIPIGDGLLKTARIGQFRPDVVRVVLDIENIRDFKIFPLSDPFRVIIDVKGERKTEISSLEQSIEQAQPEPETRPSEPVSVSERFKPGKIRRIVIDPGHGGHDPGAVGPGGIREKDVVLEIGTRLARKIKETLGIDVVMTRSTDIFIPLEERTAIANKVNADLFISVHANASLNKAASGIETYYLNLAKTDKAARVAARENNTSLEKVGMLQTILFDLMANYKINDSARLADDVQKALCARIERKYDSTRNLGVKQGPFYVLVGATMPSILVETAFISNEQEARLLTDRDYQDTTVVGIIDGIREYIRQLH